jgi:hypothetical protein
MVKAMQHRSSLRLPASGTALLCMMAVVMSCLSSQAVAGAVTHECDLLVDPAQQVS